MRIFLKLIQYLVIFAGSLCMLAFVAVLVLLKWPQILVNDRALEWGARFAESQGILVSWQSAHVEVHSPDFYRKKFSFDFRGLCIETPQARSQELESCFEVARFSVVTSVSGFKPRLVEIGPVELLDGKVKARLKKSEEPERPSEEKRPTDEKRAGLLPEWLEGVQVQPLLVDIDEWRIEESDGASSGKLDLRVVRGAQEIRGTLKAEAHLKGGLVTDLRLGLRSDHELTHFVYDLSGKLKERKLRLKVKAQGDLDSSRMTTRLTGEAENLIAEVPRFTVKDCQIESVRTRSEMQPARLSVDCPLRAKVPVPKVKWPVKWSELKIPTYAGARVKANLASAAFPFDPSEHIDGKIRVELEPILSPLFEGGGTIDADVKGVISDLPRDWKLDSDFQLYVRARDFRQLAQRLERTTWAVPAPFHVLNGFIELRANGSYDLERGILPVRLATRLSSEKQKLNIDADGLIRLRQTHPKLSLSSDLRVLLSQVRLELPHLQLEAPPRFLPDSRIHRIKGARPLKEEKVDPVAYAVTVATPPANPVNLLSNLAQGPIPVLLNLEFRAGQPLTGTVQIAEFPVELFRRKAAVDHFNIALKGPAEGTNVNGAIRIPYTDYTITVLVLGSAARPRIKLVSDPPLPEGQLFAVLLFGQPMEELDQDQSASVGNTRAALADSAIGLASFYALASTPIQSMGYDPKSGLFSAKVRLGAGTSLNLGADADQIEEIGIRKRLGPRWAITTDVNNPTTTQDRVLSAFLEWSYRY